MECVCGYKITKKDKEQSDLFEEDPAGYVAKYGADKNPKKSFITGYVSFEEEGYSFKRDKKVFGCPKCGTLMVEIK